MRIEVIRAEFRDVESMRDLYRHEAHCQIIHDSALSRSIAYPYLIQVNGLIGGYAGIWNKYHSGRVMEFYLVPHLRQNTQDIARELLRASQATHIEAQTNMRTMLTLLFDFCQNISPENILFEDALTTQLPTPGCVFRRTHPEDSAKLGPDRSEPLGDWVIEADGVPVGTGGFLCHYNPPYGDVFMEVVEHARRRGFGAYLVQELKRVCYEAGKKPAARCNPTNTISRKTLQKAGFHVCGRLLAGEVAPEP